MTKWLSRAPHPYHRQDALDWIARNAAPKPPDQTGFVLDQGDGLIGSIGFRPVDGTPDVGYWLARPCWGKGLMSEAAEAAIAWLFDVTEHEQIRSGIFDGNAASLRIQEKLGFKVTGHRTLHCLAQGADLPHTDTLLTRQRFENRNA